MVKKIAVCLVMVSLVLAVGSIAAEKKAAAPAQAPVAVAAKQPGMALGVYSIGALPVLGVQLAANMPTISYRFTDRFIGEASANYSSAGTTNAFGVTIRGDYELGAGRLVPHAGGLLGFVSGSVAGASGSSFMVGGCWGVTAYIDDNFSVTADLYPVTFNSPSGAYGTTSTFALFGGALAARYWF